MRARPCAARTRLFGLIATPNGALRDPHLRPSQLRCFLFDPKKFIKSVELGSPTSRAFFFPQDHRGYETWGPPAPRPAHRSVADPSGNNLGVKIMNRCHHTPKFFFVFLFYSFWIFSFYYSLPFLLSFSISSYSSLLISSYSSRRCYSSPSYSSPLIF